MCFVTVNETREHQEILLKVSFFSFYSETHKEKGKCSLTLFYIKSDKVHTSTCFIKCIGTIMAQFKQSIEVNLGSRKTRIYIQKKPVKIKLSLYHYNILPSLILNEG